MVRWVAGVVDGERVGSMSLIEASRANGGNSSMDKQPKKPILSRRKQLSRVDDCASSSSSKISSADKAANECHSQPVKRLLTSRR